MKLPCGFACKKYYCSLCNTRNQALLYNLARNLDNMNEQVYLLQNSIKVIKFNATF